MIATGSLGRVERLIRARQHGVQPFVIGSHFRHTEAARATDVVNGFVDDDRAAGLSDAARQVLREYTAADGLFPSGHLLTLREKAIRKYGELLELEIGNQ